MHKAKPEAHKSLSESTVVLSKYLIYKQCDNYSLYILFYL